LEKHLQASLLTHVLTHEKLAAIQYFPKLVSPLALFDCFSNPNCQDRLVYIGSYSGVSLLVGRVLFLT
jgi:hypothetical protein